MASSHPSLPSPEEDKENMKFTLPPIRDIHATPKTTTHLPPTPSTIPPIYTGQDLNLTTPVQPRMRQPLQSLPGSSNNNQLGSLTSHPIFTAPQSRMMMTPQTNGVSSHQHHQGMKNGNLPSSGLAFEEKHQKETTQIQGQSRLHQTPCPRPSGSTTLSSAARKKIHPPPTNTPFDTPSNNTFNIGHSNASGITHLKAPVSALSTRTMGRSISTPTLQMNNIPKASTYTISNRSVASTQYSPSAESNRSSSVSRAGPKSRARLSFSPSPEPSSPLPIDLSGIQPPAPFPGPYPTAYTRKDPVPSDEGEPESENKRSGRQGAPSWNPWDYVLGEVPGGEQGPNQTPVKDDDGKGNKIRRRFTKRELEALEVLWSISKSPSKYERQRLGAWLGVKTKHITVWFQNRRQEEKRYLREGAPVEPPPPSRSNRGTFDPVTGKWRPVPLSCISGLQPPPEEKSSIVRSISVGDLTRDLYFSQHPELQAHALTPTPSGRMYTSQEAVTPLPKRGMSTSLDNVLRARESGFGENKPRPHRRGSGEALIKGEGQERIREILALMPSDPPSMDLSEIAADDESETDENDNLQSPKRTPLGTSKGAMGLDRMLNGPSNGILGRATSLDILASAPRTKGKYWSSRSSNNGNIFQSRSINGSPGVLGAINPNIPQERQQITPAKPSLKHPLPSSTHSVSKRARMDNPRQRPVPTFKHKDSFSRSTSAAVLETPAAPKKDENDKERGEMKTPGFARSFSFSSNMSEGVPPTPDNVVLPKKQNGQVRKEKKPEEKDADVLGAADVLLKLLGGA
ncbi:uncharacterized protein L201_004086 [Kwoniella dendrophila CBS 6074]|uniref:Homeobox domain-containing protein n=1 Tax=Kwoniella dendrophila CBS 6074 TaxID=1295534 RepID=A0AAX4JWD3_9TREE